MLYYLCIVFYFFIYVVRYNLFFFFVLLKNCEKVRILRFGECSDVVVKENGINLLRLIMNY